MNTLAEFLEKPLTRAVAGWVALVLAGIIIFLSLIQPGGVPAPAISDKLKHFIAYGALAAPFCVFMGRRRIILAILLVVALGISMEVAQAFAGTGRSASMLDAIANALGTGTSALIYWVILSRAAKSSPAP